MANEDPRMHREPECDGSGALLRARPLRKRED
jgi:hypothetical protein